MSFDHLDRTWLEARTGAKWHRPAPGVLPAWVADMDFPTADVIIAALERYVAGRDLGYPDWEHGTVLRELFAERMTKRFGWSPDPRHVRETCDVLQTVEVALHVMTKPGDGVAVFCPSYPPILRALEHMQRRLVPTMLRRELGFAFDLDRFAAGITREGVRAVVLLNPHNPTGHVFTRAELEAIADLALRHDLLVISDEVHADLVFEGTHVPFASLGADVEAHTVTATSATKSFNIAAVRCAVAHVGSPSVRRAWRELPTHLTGVVTAFGVAATEAAWRSGDAWLGGALARLDANRHLLGSLLARHLPTVVYEPPQATYLAWLDCTALGLGDEPQAAFLEQCRVQLSPGTDFSPGGHGHARLNFATSADILTEIVCRMATARPD